MGQARSNGTIAMDSTENMHLTLTRTARMRMNDGAVDSQGRYWAGMMNDPKVQEPTDEGVLFRLDPDMTLHRMIEKVTIPNGMGWNADDNVMYFTDSPTGCHDSKLILDV